MESIVTKEQYEQYREDVDYDGELGVGRANRTADELRAEIEHVAGLIHAQLEEVGADALDDKENDPENSWLIGWLFDIGESAFGLAESIRVYMDDKSASR